MRFYFHIYDGSRVTRDTEGSEICSMRLMREVALRLLPAIAKDMLPELDSHMCSVTVSDVHGNCAFKAALNLESSWVGPQADAAVSELANAGRALNGSGP